MLTWTPNGDTGFQPERRSDGSWQHSAGPPRQRDGLDVGGVRAVAIQGDAGDDAGGRTRHPGSLSRSVPSSQEPKR